MKKIYSILALLLIAFTFGGCTLSMEEWLDEPATGEVPEELRGVDAPYTETIPDVISVTYKYNPGVRPVTTKHRSYLAYVEADTILYFYDNMPKELLPLEGEYLAAGCAPQFPDGLNHRVLTVDRAGGLYKVKTTHATVNEVYDDLVYELDVAYNPPLNDYLEVEDTTQVEYSNGNNEPEIIQDWTLYNEVKGISDEDAQYIKRANIRSRTRARNSVLTRAENNEEHDTTTSWGFTYRFDFGKSSAPEKRNWYERVFDETVFNYVSANKNKWADATFYLELSYKNSTRVRGYSKVDKKEKYEKTYTEKTETSKFGIAVGLDIGKKYNLVDEKSNFAATNTKPNFIDQQKLAGFLKNVTPQQKQKNKLKTMGFKLIIPCTVPVAMVFKFGIDVQWNFNGNLAAFVETQSVSLEGYEYIKGKKHPLQNPENKPTKSRSYSVVGSGSANFSLVPTTSVGIQFGGSLGADVGVQGTWKIFDFKAELGWDENVPGEVYTKATIGSSFIVNPFVTFYISPFGWDLWDQTITFDKNWKIYDESTNVNPELYVTEVPGQVTSEIYSELPIVEFGYGVKSIGVSLGASKYLPRAAIFVNKVSKYNLLGHMKPHMDSETDPIKSSEYYLFKYDFDLEGKEYNSDKKYIVVPALYNPTNDEYTYYTNHSYTVKPREVKMEIVGGAQEGAWEVDGEYNFTDEVGLVEYRFALDFETTNVRETSDFGVMISIPKLGIQDKKISLRRSLSWSNNVKTVGFTFYSDYVADKEKIEIEACTYVVNRITGEMSFGDLTGNLSLKYPMEWKQHFNELGLKERVDHDIE